MEADIPSVYPVKFRGLGMIMIVMTTILGNKPSPRPPAPTFPMNAPMNFRQGLHYLFTTSLLYLIFIYLPGSLGHLDLG